MQQNGTARTRRALLPQRRALPRWMASAALLGFSLALFTLLPVGPTRQGLPLASAHALSTRPAL
jgi:hypothetical protein